MPDADFLSGWDDPSTVQNRLSPALQSRNIQSPITSCTIAPLSGHSGLSGDLSKLTLTFQDSTSMQLVLKRTRSTEDAKKYSKKLGLYREGEFYSTIGPWIQKRLDQVPNSSQRSFIPKALYAASNTETGQKAVVLEYYDAAEAGVHFPHSVHNVVREMELKEQNQEHDASSELTNDNSSATKARAKAITMEATRIAASIHGTFYQDISLLTNTPFANYLRMGDWIRGQNKQSYLESQQEVVDRWSNAKARSERGDFFNGKVKLGKEFVEVMDASCSMALDFDAFVSMWNMGDDKDKIAWSLVHGDYHPGNMLCLNEEYANNDEPNGPNLLIVDWEVVGVGSGPQDIGQFLISHTETKEAINMLDEVASVYRETLITTLKAVNKDKDKRPAAPSIDTIKREMIYGGIERWVWLFGYMAGWENNMPWLYMQYFHDQMQGWIVANGVNAKSVGMPRP